MIFYPKLTTLNSKLKKTMQQIHTPQGNLSTILLRNLQDIGKAIDFVQTKQPTWVSWINLLTKIKEGLLLLRSYHIKVEDTLTQMEYTAGENEMLKQIVGRQRAELDTYRSMKETVYLSQKEVEDILLRQAALVQIEGITNPKEKLDSLIALVKEERKSRETLHKEAIKLLLKGKSEEAALLIKNASKTTE